MRADGLEADTLTRTDILTDWVTLEDLLATGILEHDAEAQWQWQQARDRQLLELAHSELPLSALPPEFGTLPDKARAYAEFLGRHFNPDRPPGACAWDTAAVSNERVIISWEGTVPKREKTKVETVLETALLFAGPVGAIVAPFASRQKTEKVAFVTAIDLSQAEADRIRQGQKMARRLTQVGTVAIALSLVCFVAGGMAWISSPGSDYSDTTTTFYIWLLVAVVMFGTGFYLVHRASHHRNDSALKTLAKLPFQMKKLEWANSEPE
ncbi:MAG: hypothetical protein ABSH19_09660 [Opitutales bacterium]